MRKLAVIGTAGRDRSHQWTLSLWQSMCDDLRQRLLPGDVLVSGGAAWADHLAVHAFLGGWSQGLQLELYLPAPVKAGRFIGKPGSAGAAAAFYHGRFSDVIGVDTQRELVQAYRAGANVKCEPPSESLAPMFVRNAKIAAAASACLAYTFGEGEVPAKGGTLDTWNKLRCTDKMHVSLLRLQEMARQRCPDEGQRQ